MQTPLLDFGKVELGCQGTLYIDIRNPSLLTQVGEGGKEGVCMMPQRGRGAEACNAAAPVPGWARIGC